MHTHDGALKLPSASYKLVLLCLVAFYHK